MPTGDDGGAPADGPVLFKDDFSDPASGWTTKNSPGWIDEYMAGRFHMQIDNGAQQYVRSESNLPRMFGDAIIAVSAEQAGGADSIVIGLKCRVSSAGAYFFDVSPDGTARIHIYQAGKQTVLAKSEGTSIDPKHVSIKAGCVGDQLTLWSDGKKILTASDKTYAMGSIGMCAGAAGSGITDVFFDDLVVTGP